jgi:hypothetical protein
MRQLGNLAYRKNDDGPAYLLNGRPVHDGDMVMFLFQLLEEPAPMWSIARFNWSGSARSAPTVRVRYFGEHFIDSDSRFAWPPPEVVEFMRLRDELRVEHQRIEELAARGACAEQVRKAVARFKAIVKRLYASLNAGSTIEGIPVHLGAVGIPALPTFRSRQRPTGNPGHRPRAAKRRV